MRGRRQRARRRRREARLIADGLESPRRRRADRRRARLRLHQRFPRRGQFDRHGRLDARAVTRQGGHLGGVLQFRRGVHVRHRRRQDRRLRPGRYQDRHVLGDLRGADRRDRLGPDHLVLRAADQLVARADRRLRRRGGGQGGLRRDHPAGLDQDAHLHRPGAAHRHGPRRSCSWWRSSGCSSGPRRAASISWFRRLQLAVGGRATASGHGGNDAQKTMGIIAGVLVAGGYLESGQRTAADSLVGRFWRRTRRSRWARSRAAGASSTRWARRSPSCRRSAASPRRPAARSRSSRRRTSACRVSTTHTITGAIIGVGSIRRLSAVRWGVAGRIVWAWMLTIPAAAADRRGHLLDRRRARSRRRGRQPGLGVRRSALAWSWSARTACSHDIAPTLNLERRAPSRRPSILATRS